MLRTRRCVATYCGRCRRCQKPILGMGANTVAQFVELVYSGVATVGELPRRRLRWHLACYAKEQR